METGLADGRALEGHQSAPGTASSDESRLLVVGGETAKGLATHLADEWRVRLLSDDESVVGRAASDRLEALAVEFTSADLRPHAADVNTAIVLAERDRVALFVAQILGATCDVDRVLARVDDPTNRSAFEGIDCKIIDTGPLFGLAVDQTLE